MSPNKSITLLDVKHSNPPTCAGYAYTTSSLFWIRDGASQCLCPRQSHLATVSLNLRLKDNICCEKAVTLPQDRLQITATSPRRASESLDLAYGCTCPYVWILVLKMSVT
ncbi:unnamed protein product [Protopolystoma xenopodis]|uniref:Uncharacterized protein n=1 Tax=Protopolystoma xenopodis TaxID=117903 RepID=A0A448XSJ9_9PLAT|nr:unnamed protein product [Protopolystoma xenopodis]